MLPLNSPRWSELRSAVGDGMVVAQRIAELREHPSQPLWDEVLEDVAHQFTVYEAAFAAVPHLVELAVAHGLESRPDFLFGLGRIAAALGPDRPVPADLEPDFAKAMRRGAVFALDAAKARPRSLREYHLVLFAAAALNGRQQLARGWFSVNLSEDQADDEAELECPACGAYLLGRVQNGSFQFQAVDTRLRSTSASMTVSPRAVDATVSKDDSVTDFDWLAQQCRAAGQDRLIPRLCELYGEVVCPKCDDRFDVMSAVERSHS